MRHLLASLTLLLPSVAVRAQGDCDFDKVTSGTLGATLNLLARNANPNATLLGMVSTTAGPTAVSLVDPTDPRSVAVGLDLAGAWWLQATSGTGTAATAVPLPSGIGFQGLYFFWQCATFPGTSYIVGEISNPLTTHHAMPSTSTALPNPLLQARASATLCWARNRNAGQGDFLLVSGTTTEFFGFRDLASTPGPNMIVPRGVHAAATLNDGRVLFTGGIDGTSATTATCEIYDPITNTFTPTGSMLGARAGHAAATLPDGRVMVVGGASNFTDLTTAATSALNTAELWNPATGLWTSAPAIGGRRLVPSLTRISTGRMLIAGGIEVTLIGTIPIAVSSTTKAQLYNPATNSWSNTANMPFGRSYHQDNQVTLNDGRVLLCGGVLVPSLANVANAASIANADLYNPATGTWTTTLMSAARTGHSATLLPNGDVIVAGGASGLLSAPTTLDTIARFVPGTNTWSDLGVMTTARVGHTAAVLPDGMLVILGGAGLVSEAMHF